MPILHYPRRVVGWHYDAVDIRDRIKAVIDAKPGLTVRNVSLAAGLSDSALHKFLTGATDSLTLKTVDKLADALGVDAFWLAYGKGEPEQATDVEKEFNRIAPEQRDQALRVLRSFQRTGTDD